MRKISILFLCCLAIAAFIPSMAGATNSWGNDFNSEYPETLGTPLAGNSCTVCHTNGFSPNDYANDMLAASGNNSERITAVENLDSDCDGYSNIEEIIALTFPDDPNDYPNYDPIDDDGDGVLAVSGEGCGRPTDCNDQEPNAFPGALEDCTDGIDNDCDGLVDTQDPDAEGCPVACTDFDEDTYAIEGGECGQVDCNDEDPQINPGATEDCDDDIDNNCNNSVNENCPLVEPDPPAPTCTDNDNDGFTVEGEACAFGTQSDCNDQETRAYPGATEDCSDGIDNDCDGLVDTLDEDCPVTPQCIDADSDGYNAFLEGVDCGPVDCDDTNEFINPRISEICDDGIDNNCNDNIDEADPACQIVEPPVVTPPEIESPTSPGDKVVEDEDKYKEEEEDDDEYKENEEEEEDDEEDDKYEEGDDDDKRERRYDRKRRFFRSYFRNYFRR